MSEKNRHFFSDMRHLGLDLAPSDSAALSNGDTHVRLVVSASLGMGADETEMKHEIRQLAERLLRPLKASDPTVTKPSSPQTGVV